MKLTARGLSGGLTIPALLLLSGCRLDQDRPGGPDLTAPAAPTSLTATPATGVALTWTNPTTPDLAGVLIARFLGGQVPGAPADGMTYAVGAMLPGGGEVVFAGASASLMDRTAPAGDVHYAAFAYDAARNYSARALALVDVVAVFVPNLQPETTLNTNGLGTSRSYQPEICCEGRDVYVAWQDDRNQSGVDQIFFNASPDGGLTWSPMDTRLDTGAGDAGSVRLSCGEGNVYAVWNQKRSGGKDDIFFNRSTDRGLTWLAQDVRLDTDGPSTGDSDWVEICSDGSNVFVAWLDDRPTPGTHDVYFNGSTDGGATWLASDVRLNSAIPDSSEARDLQMACEGQSVYVVWADDRNGEEDIYLNYSTDAGTTWLAQDIRLDTDAPGASDSERPVLCLDLPYVYVAWEDQLLNNGNEDIYVNCSSDGGATWFANMKRIDTDALGAADSENLAIACDGRSVHVVWSDDRSGGVDNLHYNRSFDGGVTWLSQDVRLNSNAAGASISRDASISCQGSNVYVTFEDTRAGSEDPWFVYSTDGGTTWAPDVRLDADSAFDDDGDPEVCSDGTNVYLVWKDRRHGEGDIYFRGSVQ